MKHVFTYLEEDKKAPRLDLFLQKKTGDSRTYIQEQIDAGAVLVNGSQIKKASHTLKVGDCIEAQFIPRAESTLTPIAHPLEILYEDAHFLILNKEQGVVVHPAKGHFGETLVHYLLHYLKDLDSFAELDPERPGLVHRLDRGTSGAILIAKNRKIQSALSSLFKERKIQKEYEAIVWGQPAMTGNWNTAIGRDPVNRKKMSSRGEALREAVTVFKTINRFAHFTHLALFPRTGRTHQLRVHLTEAGFPIVGDDLYGVKTGLTKTKSVPPIIQEQIKSLKMTLLHAKNLKFEHPVTKVEMNISAPRTKIFESFLNLLKEHDPCTA